MASILSIARYTFLQQFRNRLYLVIGLFGLLMVGVSLLFGAVAADQEVRVIVDVGLAAIELFGVVMSVFGAVTLVLEEMESRTIYLILTRPIPRFHYLFGRYLGLFSAVAASMALMAAFHGLLIYFKGFTPGLGWEADARYFVCLPVMGLKVMVVTALALFFSLFSTSAVSSVVFTFFFWVLGHFGAELRYLAGKSENPLTAAAMKAFLFLAPNMSFLNYRDFFEAPGASAGQALWAAGYAVLYSAACLTLSWAFFSRKEF